MMFFMKSFRKTDIFIQLLLLLLSIVAGVSAYGTKSNRSLFASSLGYFKWPVDNIYSMFDLVGPVLHSMCYSALYSETFWLQN